jgi:hypothetical protein
MADADNFVLGLVPAEENRRSKPLPLSSLIALSMFREEKRLTSEQLVRGIQQDKKRATHMHDFRFMVSTIRMNSTGPMSP